MEFRFDPDLDYQQRAIQSVVRLFEGQARQAPDLALLQGDSMVANRLSLDDAALLANLRAVQTDPELQNGAPIAVAEALDGLDYSVEMETGTGKTYVYLRTAFELWRAYGWSKFIIIVPSVAIREGVLQTFEDTRAHFRQLYDRVPYRYVAYDSARLGDVGQFARSNDLEFMVMTLQSFRIDANVFNRESDRMMGKRPLDLVRAARPILILDEPQNMESDLAREALDSLQPLFRLRYSASHRALYNLVHRLTPVDAYNLGLVKQIEVASVVEDHDQSNADITCLSVDAKKTTLSARLKLYAREGYTPVPKTRTVRQGDDLHEITQLDAYRGYRVESLDAREEEVRFGNGVVLRVGQQVGPDPAEVARVQIAYTIEEHMRKAARLREQGIKVLSLFFIDEVANYTGQNGHIRRAFDRAFCELRDRGEPWAAPYLGLDPADVQASYFSEYKTDRSIEQDTEAYDLIMKAKGQLLSFGEKREFIFSHSALREGWDSPNIFQICTLNRTLSTIRKRQEIGRGMRLAVNQQGERVFDRQVNRLTVIANESYQEYVERLQCEYMDEVGTGQAPPKADDARKRRPIKLVEGYASNRAFAALWERVAQRTRYRVRIDDDRLVTDCARAVAQVVVGPVKIRTERAQIGQIAADGTLETTLIGQRDEAIERQHTTPHLTDRLAQETGLTRRTLRRILLHAGNLELATINPGAYLHAVAEAINQAKRRHLVEGIQYVDLGDVWDSGLFRDMGGYEDSVVPSPSRSTTAPPATRTSSAPLPAT